MQSFPNTIWYFSLFLACTNAFVCAHVYSVQCLFRCIDLFVSALLTSSATWLRISTFFCYFSKFIEDTNPKLSALVLTIVMFFSLSYYCSLMFYLQSNPIARWHICQGSINSIVFSTDGAYLATVGRDGILFIRYSCYFIDKCHL